MNDAKTDRRTLLGGLLASAAIVGFATPQAEATPHTAAESLSKSLKTEGIEDALALARLRSYRTRHESSWDRTGGNDDARPLAPGASLTLFAAQGAGVITHLWFTIATEDATHLKSMVLRAWWDGEATPSVEVPLGDFFGLGLGDYFLYQSQFTSVAPIKGLNAYFPMPFASAALITLTNEGAIKADSVYFAVDAVELDALPADVGRFHAQYRQAAPLKGEMSPRLGDYEPAVSERKNLEGAGNYVYLEAVGHGHFLGVHHAVVQNQEGWFGEGDEMYFIDGERRPSWNGTGSEDFFNGAWNFGQQSFAYQRNGAPYMAAAEHAGGRYCLYRWHSEAPVAFQHAFRATIEHGHANHRSDSYYTTAFWYQSEPHAAFPALPPAAERVAGVKRLDG